MAVVVPQKDPLMFLESRTMQRRPQDAADALTLLVDPNLRVSYEA